MFKLHYKTFIICRIGYQGCSIPSLVALEKLDNKISINKSHVSVYIKYLNQLNFSNLLLTCCRRKFAFLMPGVYLKPISNTCYINRLSISQFQVLNIRQIVIES